MAEGFANQLSWDSYSAGTHPEIAVNPNAIKVMDEMDIDINHHKPELLDSYLKLHFNIVASVCDNAKQSCPAFIGNSDSIIHQSFQDLANEKGSKDEILNEFRNVRDLIKVWVNSL
jgi:arsenate reductase